MPRAIHVGLLEALVSSCLPAINLREGLTQSNNTCFFLKEKPKSPSALILHSTLTKKPCTHASTQQNSANPIAAPTPGTYASATASVTDVAIMIARYALVARAVRKPLYVLGAAARVRLPCRRVYAREAIRLHQELYVEGGKSDNREWKLEVGEQKRRGFEKMEGGN